MPKMKSIKGAVKRFKIKKNGQIKRGRAFRSHILTKVDAKHGRDAKSAQYVDKSQVKNIKNMIS